MKYEMPAKCPETKYSWTYDLCGFALLTLKHPECDENLKIQIDRVQLADFLASGKAVLKLMIEHQKLLEKEAHAKGT